MIVLSNLLENRVLQTSLIAWIVAQLLKFMIYAIRNREFNLSRLFGDGGMPSGHSATVTALAVSSGFSYGFHSAAFAISAILALIVMHDAMGVRQESGKHAQIINELLAILRLEYCSDSRLKEFLGHTPFQVVGGLLVGLFVALFMY